MRNPWNPRSDELPGFPPSVYAYVSHLADDDRPKATLCGEPWQGWQAPDDYDLLRMTVLPPYDKPQPHQDQVRFCGACRKAAML